MFDTDQLSEQDIADLIKEVRQGHGLSPQDVQAWLATAKSQDVTEDEATRVMLDIDEAVALLPDRNQRAAVGNALGLHGSQDDTSTLTDRRMEYLSGVDISLRTLIRYEDAGALATGEMLKALWRGDVSATDVDLDRVDAHLITITRRLRNIDARVENLSQKVEQMNDLLARLVTMSDMEDLPFTRETYAARESAYKKRSMAEYGATQPISTVECGPIAAPRNLLEDTEGSFHK